MREAIGVHVPGGARCIVSGIDLVRDGEGVHRVLEDNLRVPSGVAYVLENRAAIARALPVAFEGHRVRPVNHYGASLHRTLCEVAPGGNSDPTVVVLTPGVFNSAHFEHVFLARQMGVELVEGRDLVVEDNRVHMRTTRGLQRVDVIYRRIGDESIDPVVFRPDSLLGVPGLMSAVRAGTVTLANAIGNGVIDDKALYPFVPALIRHYRARSRSCPTCPPTTPGTPTSSTMCWAGWTSWWSSPRANRAATASSSAARRPTRSWRRRPRTSSATRARSSPRRRSRCPRIPRGWATGWSRATSTCGRSCWPGSGVEIVPGGLTRVALRKGSLIVNSSQGGGSKDTWVLAAALMLARHAEDLLWIGRYLERAEDTARLLDVTYHTTLEAARRRDRAGRLAGPRRGALPRGRDRGHGPARSWPGSWSPTRTTADRSWRASRGPGRTPGASASGSRWSCGRRSTRSTWSSPRWILTGRWNSDRTRCVSWCDADARPSSAWRPRRCPGRRATSSCSWASSWSGAASPRACCPCGSGGWRASARSAGFLEWTKVLRSASAYEAYLREHHAQFDGLRVLSFLLASRELPRSVLYCLEVAERQLVSLASGPYGRASLRAIGRVRSDVEFAEPTHAVGAPAGRLPGRARRPASRGWAG